MYERRSICIFMENKGSCVRVRARFSVVVYRMENACLHCGLNMLDGLFAKSKIIRSFRFRHIAHDTYTRR